MAKRRPKVLAYGEEVYVGHPEMNHGLADLIFGLSETDHD
jgi:hypothetical protein